MGKFEKGILGSISGKVGTIVGSRWKGKEVVRSNGIRRNKNFSDTQLVQQAKFAVAGKFIKKLKTLFEISFRPRAIGKSGQNVAMSELLNSAITGVYPNFAIDYSKVSVSADTELPPASAPAAASTAPGVINFTWTDNSNLQDAKPSDKALVVTYCLPLNRAIYNTAAAQRSDAAAVLNVPDLSGFPVHTWIAFISENGKQISASSYTGMVNVQ